MARIENHKYSIEEAFRECFYIVPDYQREYVWTDKEVHQLLEDIRRGRSMRVRRGNTSSALCWCRRPIRRITMRLSTASSV
jgi:hypothetical protein